MSKGKEIYYDLEKKECDFIIKNGLNITQAIQVCLNIENSRELEGLKSAMSRYKLKEGIILSMEDEDHIGNIKIIPVYKWMLENNV